MAVTVNSTVSYTGGIIQLNGYIPGQKFGSSVLALSGGGFAVAYGNHFSTTDTPALSIYNDDGTSIWEGVANYQLPFSGAALDVKMVGAPEIAENSDGSIEFRWISERQALIGTNGDLYAARVSASGSIAESGHMIANTANMQEISFAIGEGSGNQVALYTETPGLQPYLNVRNSNGDFRSIYWVDHTSGLSGGDVQSTDITSISDGTFLIGLVRNGTTTTNPIWLQFRQGGGPASGNMFLFDPVGPSDSDTDIALLALPNGGFAISYVADFPGGPGVVMAIVNDPINDPDGTGLFRVDTDLAADDRNVDLAALPNGWIVASWTEISTSGDTSIKGRVMDASGNPISEVFLVSSGLTNADESSLDVLLNGDIVASWTDELSLGSGDTIQGRIFSLQTDITGDETPNHIIGTINGEIIRGLAENDTLEGAGGDDLLLGGGNDDSLLGNDGEDTLVGGDGNDQLLGGQDADLLEGSAGNDTLDGGLGADSLVGGLGDDVLIGRPGAEVLDGSPGGSDTVDYSQAATDLTLRLWNSTVSGDPVANGDTLLNFENAQSGSGNDRLEGSFLANRLKGNVGADTLFGFAGDDRLEGDEGNDFLSGGSHSDTLIGGSGNDTLDGGAGTDSIVGGPGDDLLIGRPGAEVLDGSPGDRDSVSYATAAGQIILKLFDGTVSGDPIASGDTILNLSNAITGAGDDLIAGDAFANSLSGNGGNDTIVGRGGADSLEGGNGFDVLDGGLDGDHLSGGAHADILRGGAGNDTLDGGSGADTLVGGIGDDILIGNLSPELLDGSPGGSDTIVYSQATGDLVLQLWNQTVSGDPLANRDVLRNFENAEGGNGNDLLSGSFLANRLVGNGGNDTISGHADADTLEGGAGADDLRGGTGADVLRGGIGNDLIVGGTETDALTGGADADTFLFRTADEAGLLSARDQIMDFEKGLDLIDVSGIASAAFVFRATSGFTASSTSELTLFETASGSTIVRMDIDGDGSTDAEIRVAGVTGLTAGDFLL